MTTVSLTFTPFQVGLLMTGLQAFIKSFETAPPEDDDEKIELNEAKQLVEMLKDAYHG